MISLFCFPSSGSSASMYHAWVNKVKLHHIKLITLEYHGRGTRFSEPFAPSINSLCQDLLRQIKPYLAPHQPIAFFGHSLGGLVCFEMARLMKKQGMPLPAHLIISSRQSPLCTPPTMLSPVRSDDELTETLFNMGGLPESILAHSELMALLLPIIRSDLNLNQRYWCNDLSSLPIPITTIYGNQDPVIKRDNVLKWQQFTDREFKILTMSGDHFYFNKETDKFLLNLIELLIQH